MARQGSFRGDVFRPKSASDDVVADCPLGYGGVYPGYVYCRGVDDFAVVRAYVDSMVRLMFRYILLYLKIF